MSRNETKSLQSLFDTLRRKYFPGRLRGYRSVWTNFPWSSFSASGHAGECDSKTRTLRIQKGLSGDHLVETLLHEMNHVGCPFHGKKFREGIERLQKMGAPVAN